MKRFIAIVSPYNNFILRDSVRNSWLKNHEKGEYKFFVDKETSESDEVFINAEIGSRGFIAGIFDWIKQNCKEIPETVFRIKDTTYVEFNNIDVGSFAYGGAIPVVFPYMKSVLAFSDDFYFVSRKAIEAFESLDELADNEQDYVLLNLIKIGLEHDSLDLSDKTFILTKGHQTVKVPSKFKENEIRNYDFENIDMVKTEGYDQFYDSLLMYTLPIIVSAKQAAKRFYLYDKKVETVTLCYYVNQFLISADFNAAWHFDNEWNSVDELKIDSAKTTDPDLEKMVGQRFTKEGHCFYENGRYVLFEYTLKPYINNLVGTRWTNCLPDFCEDRIIYEDGTVRPNAQTYDASDLKIVYCEKERFVTMTTGEKPVLTNWCITGAGNVLPVKFVHYDSEVEETNAIRIKSLENKPEVFAFWYDPLQYKTSPIWIDNNVIGALKTFNDNGYKVILWSYQYAQNAPEWLEVRHADEIVDPAGFFTSEDTPAFESIEVFSGWFRLNLLAKYPNAIWTECDTICLNDKFPKADYFVADVSNLSGPEYKYSTSFCKLDQNNVICKFILNKIKEFVNAPFKPTEYDSEHFKNLKESSGSLVEFLNKLSSRDLSDGILSNIINHYGFGHMFTDRLMVFDGYNLNYPFMFYDVDRKFLPKALTSNKSVLILSNSNRFKGRAATPLNDNLHKNSFVNHLENAYND